MPNTVKVELTIEEALKLGLIVCECGWPQNNHFDFGRKLCAHGSCKGYTPKLRVGKLIEPLPTKGWFRNEE